MRRSIKNYSCLCSIFVVTMNSSVRHVITFSVLFRRDFDDTVAKVFVYIFRVIVSESRITFQFFVQRRKSLFGSDAIIWQFFDVVFYRKLRDVSSAVEREIRFEFGVNIILRCVSIPTLPTSQNFLKEELTDSSCSAKTSTVSTLWALTRKHDVIKLLWVELRKTSRQNPSQRWF